MKNIIFLLIIITITISACNTNHTQNNLTSRDSAIMNIQNLEHRLYGDSVQVIKRGVAMETIIAYAKFAHNFPEDSLSPEFLFKAAEIARALHNGKEAVLYYNMIYTDFPENEKAPTALFLEAFTYENILKDTAQARILYQNFIDKYPNNQFADDARYSLKYLGKSAEELIKIFENNDH